MIDSEESVKTPLKVSVETHTALCARTVRRVSAIFLFVF